MNYYPGVAANYYPAARAGVGLSINDITDWLATNAGSGANALGQLSILAANTGMSIEAFRAALNTIASNAGAAPWQVDWVRDELAYLNNGGGSSYFRRETNWPLWIGVGLLAYVVVRN